MKTSFSIIWIGMALGFGLPMIVLGDESPAAPSPDNIRLLVRADDMGSSHAANVACIRSYRQGIVRSVELMVPGP